MTFKQPLPKPTSPYPCTWCKKQDAKDFLVEIGVAPIDQAICFDCKVKIGEEMIVSMGKSFAKGSGLKPIDRINPEEGD